MQNTHRIHSQLINCIISPISLHIVGLYLKAIFLLPSQTSTDQYLRKYFTITFLQQGQDRPNTLQYRSQAQLYENGEQINSRYVVMEIQFRNVVMRLHLQL